MGVTVLGDLAANGRRLSGRVERRLVSCLVAHRFHALEPDFLIEAIWGEAAPRKATAALHSQVSRLRPVLGSDAVTWTGWSYAVEFKPGALDAAQFEEDLLLTRGSGTSQERLDALDSALALWRGEPFGDVASETFVQAESTRLRSLHDDGRVRRLMLLDELERHEELIISADGLLTEDPWLESVIALRARALAASGRARYALSTIADHRRRLVEQSGLDTGPDIARAEQLILRGGPLDLSTAKASPTSAGALEWTGSIDMSPPFVGREAELRELHGRLLRTSFGVPAIISISGPAGSGKSRLADEAARIARDLELTVAMAACHEGLALPFEPVDRLIAQVDQVDRGRSHAALPGTPIGSQLADIQRVEFEVGRLAMRRAEMLIESARQSPLALIVDDVQWADEGSAWTLRVLASAITTAARQGPLRLVLIVVRRPGSSQLDEQFARLDHEPCSAVIDPRPLTTAETAALIEACTESHASYGLVRAAAEAADGNPLAVVNGLRALRNGRMLRLRGGALAADDAAEAFNMNVDAAVEAMLALTTAAERLLLASIALLRPGGSPTEISRLLGSPLADVFNALDAGDRAGLVTLRTGHVRFRHPTYRSALCASLTPSAQHRVHLGIAERLGQPTTDAEVLVMAWHLSHARTEITGRHRNLFLAAADRCSAACEWFEATRYYELALRDAAAPSPAAGARAGVAAFRADDLARANVWFEQAADQAHCERDLEAWATAVVALQRARLTTIGNGEVDTTELAAVADTLATSHPRGHAQACSLLAEVSYAQRDLASGREWLARAQRASSTLNDPALTAQVEFASGLVDLGAADLLAARAHFQACDAAAGQANEPWIRSMAQCRLALSELLMGDLLGAQSTVTVARQSAESSAAGADHALALAVQASIEAALGHRDAAAVTASEADLVWRRTRYPFVVPLLFPLLVWCDLTDGNAAGAFAVLDRWASAGVGGHTPWRVMAHAMAGQTEAAAELLARRPLRLPPAGVELGLADVHLPVILAAISSRLGHRDLLRQSITSLDQLSHRGVAYVPGWPVHIREFMRPPSAEHRQPLATTP